MAEENKIPRLGVEVIESLEAIEMIQLCNATKEAIQVGEGFNWITPPPAKRLESYWKGVMAMPDRTLFIARIDGQVAGACQLVRPASTNEASAFRAEIMTFFLAPWARGFSLAKNMIKELENHARAQGFRALDSHMRADQQATIATCEWAGMTRWAEQEKYALIDGQFIAGYYYSKDLD